jgi:hypothetical protein
LAGHVHQVLAQVSTHASCLLIVPALFVARLPSNGGGHFIRQNQLSVFATFLLTDNQMREE